MEFFTATGKLKKFFLTTIDVRCVHHGWHGTHRYDVQVAATHASTCWRVCGNNLNMHCSHTNLYITHTHTHTHTHIYIYIYLFTLQFWRGALRQITNLTKQSVSWTIFPKLVKKFPTIYGIQIFISFPTKVRLHVPILRQNNPVHVYPNRFL